MINQRRHVTGRPGPLSPIALASARVAHANAAGGIPIKGTGRKRTHYARPSIADQIARAPSIEDLAKVRDVLASAHAAGEIDAGPGTRRRWNEALWVRVIELMSAATTPEAVTFVYSATLRWPKPAEIEAALAELMRERVAAMPAPALRWANGGQVG